MKFDGNRGWKQASGLVAGNRDVLVAVAGVFFLLPALAFTLLTPEPPQQAAGMDRHALVMATGDYLLHVMPLYLPVFALQWLGVLAMLTLFADRARPTVGQSLRRAIADFGPYVGAQLMLGAIAGIAAGLAGAIAGIAGSLLALIVMLAIFLVAIAYLSVKASLVAPVIVVEHVRNPWAALVRSWRLTRDNGIRIAMFYLLVLLAFGVAIGAAVTVLGTVLRLVAPPLVALIVSAVVSSALSAAVMVYFVAIQAAVHRQLADGSAELERAPFA